MGGRLPAQVLLSAIGQWVVVGLLAVARSALLRLPVPLLEALVMRYQFSWLARLTCDLNRCLVSYWGSYTVSYGEPVMRGWYLVEAKHRSTGARAFAFRAVWRLPVVGLIHVMIGHRIKPAFAVIPRVELVGVRFTVGRRKIAGKTTKKFAKR